MPADFDHAAFRKSETKRDAALQRELDLSLGYYCRTAALLDVCGGSHEILIGLFAQMSDILALPGIKEKALALGRARLSGYVTPLKAPDELFLVALAHAPGPALAHILESGRFQRVSDENVSPVLYEGVASGKALKTAVSARGGTVMRYDRPIAPSYLEQTSGNDEKVAAPPVVDGGVVTTTTAAEPEGDLRPAPAAVIGRTLNPPPSGEQKEETGRSRLDGPDRTPFLVPPQEPLPRKSTPGQSSTRVSEARSLAFFPELDSSTLRSAQQDPFSPTDGRPRDPVESGAATEPLAAVLTAMMVRDAGLVRP